MFTLRTRFARDIVTEFLPPVRVTKKTRVVIFADGMPGVPNKEELLRFYSDKGYWVFHPRYRGAWESDGKFLARSPHEDILDVIEGIHKNFTAIWEYDLRERKKFKLTPDEIILIGSSFGGPAMILASRDKRVNKTLVISPVINWNNPGKDERIEWIEKFTAEAFGMGYRIAKNGWKKIASGKFYNPVNHVKEINGTNLLMIHAKDDTVCRYSETKNFAAATKAKLITLPKGGHLGSSILIKPRFYKAFQKFINS